MSKKSSLENIEPVDRRHHWRDRRSGKDRRNNARLNLTNYDCRSGQPRRAADICGALADGDIWWTKGGTVKE